MLTSQARDGIEICILKDFSTSTESNLEELEELMRNYDAIRNEVINFKEEMTSAENRGKNLVDEYEPKDREEIEAIVAKQIASLKVSLKVMTSSSLFDFTYYRQLMRL